MRYRVWHRTTYTYDDDVSDSLGLAYLVPRELPWQRRLDGSIAIEPEPVDLDDDLDYYGNRPTYFQVTTAHRELRVTGTSEVEVDDTRHDDTALALPWEQARPALRRDLPDAWRAVDFTLPSPLIDRSDAVLAYAATSLTPGRPLAEAVTDLVHRIHADFQYDPKATTVTSRVEDVLAQRAGVCQDFAQLTIAALRTHGLAARYVSGYLSTVPPPGKDHVFGADASHAWLAVWAPGPVDAPWYAVDPTNDQAADHRYVTVAWGRDYGDVPPLKGVIFTDAEKSTLKVEVDVEALGQEG